MRYFKLYPTVTVITSEKNSCLYDFANGMMISIDRKYSELIDRCKKFMSIDDMKIRAKIGDSVTELLKQFGCLEGMSQSNQLSLFG